MNTKKTKGGLVIFLFAVIVLSAAIRPKYGGSLELLTPVARLSLEAIEIQYPTLLYNQFITCQEGVFESDYFTAIDINSVDNLVTLRAADNQFYSDGKPLTPESLYSFLREADEMKRLSEMLSRQSGAEVSFHLSGDTIRISVNGITPFMLLTLYSGIPFRPATPNTYTGPFYPYLANDNRIKLRANRFFPGGRPYLDEIRIRRTESARLLPALIAEDSGGASIRLTGSRYSEMLKGRFRRFHSIEFFYLVFSEEFDADSILDVAVTIDAADFIHGLTGGFGREFQLTADSEADETGGDYISSQTARNICLQFGNDPFHSNVALRVKRVLEEKGYHVQTRIRGREARVKSESGIVYLFSNITERWREYKMHALKARISQSLGVKGLYLKKITGCGDAKSASEAIERLAGELKIVPLFEIDNYLLFTPNVKGISTWADLWLYNEGGRVGN